MQTKAIFLLFIFGAAAVPFDKDISEDVKEEKPGSSDKPTEIKVPCPPPNLTDTEQVHFLVTFIGGPSKYIPLDSEEYEEEYEESSELPEGEEEETGESSESSGENFEGLGEIQNFDDSRLYNASHTQKYFWYFKKGMKKLISEIYEKFKDKEKNVEEEEEKTKNQFKSEKDITEQKVKAQETEIKEAMQNGKDKDKIHECFTQEKLNFNSQMNSDYESALECVTDSAGKARIILKNSRDAFTKTSDQNFNNAKHWSGLVKSCVKKNNGFCIQKGIKVLRKGINKIGEAGNGYLENLDKALGDTRAKMDDCCQKFVGKLKEGEDAYITKMRKCIV